MRRLRVDAFVVFARGQSGRRVVGVFDHAVLGMALVVRSGELAVRQTHDAVRIVGETLLRWFQHHLGCGKVHIGGVEVVRTERHQLLLAVRTRAVGDGAHMCQGGDGLVGVGVDAFQHHMAHLVEGVGGSWRIVRRQHRWGVLGACCAHKGQCRRAEVEDSESDHATTVLTPVGSRSGSVFSMNDTP